MDTNGTAKQIEVDLAQDIPILFRTGSLQQLLSPYGYERLKNIAMTRVYEELLAVAGSPDKSETATTAQND